MKKYILILILLLSLIFLLWVYLSFKCDKDLLEINFLNVGQGDAAYIRFPNNSDVLIDTGPYNSITKSLSSVMPTFDFSLNTLFITHMDSDHHGGLPVLAKNIKIKKLITGEVFESEDKSLKIFLEDHEGSITLQTIKAGSKIIIDQDKNIFFEVMHPSSETNEEDINDQSIIMRLVYGDVSLLLMGDASKKIEKEILFKYPDNIKSNILKLGHHGSNTSSDKLFLEKVNPEYAIISAGADNSYGHPHEEVIQSLEDLKINYLETKEGTITFESDGREIWQKKKHSTFSNAFSECFR